MDQESVGKSEASAGEKTVSEPKVLTPEEQAQKRARNRERARERFERRSKAVTDALRTLIRDFHSSQFPQHEGGGKPQTLQLTLDVDPSADWELSFTPDLADQLVRQLEDAEAGAGQFIDGAVYSFHAETSDDTSCRPPSLTEVFAGYSSLGHPQWKEFAQVLIDQKDDRAGDLYDARSPLVCVVQYGNELKKELLASYGRASKTFSILGQVVAGYLALHFQLILWQVLRVSRFAPICALMPVSNLPCLITTH